MGQRAKRGRLIGTVIVKHAITELFMSRCGMNRWASRRVGPATFGAALSLALALHSTAAAQNAAKNYSPEEKKAIEDLANDV